MPGVDDPRDVGVLMARNPIPLVIPCHRVVASDGLGGYGGGLDLKQRLLELEGVLPPRLDLDAVSSVRSMETRSARGQRASRIARRPRLQQLRRARSISRERARSSTLRSTSASRSSTRRRSTATVATASGSSARCSTGAATRSSSRPSSAGGGSTARRLRARTSASAIDGSLERLRTDYVDLYYLHKPDPATPIAETLGALDELVREGKVRAIGCSNFSAEQLAEADRVARELGTARFTVLQNQYSLLERGDDDGVLPLCRELGVSYIPYFPLASGLLTGKYRRGEPAPEGTRLAGREIADDRFERVEALHRIRGGARPLAARARHLRARLDAGGRVDHRRCDEARAGAGERRRSGRLLAALGRRARRAREALATARQRLTARTQIARLAVLPSGLNAVDAPRADSDDVG